MKRNPADQKPNYKSEDIKISKSDNWRTPHDLFDKINREFHFDVDRAADKDNALCDLFYSKEESCVVSDFGNWSFRGFINPPYSDPGPFFYKAHEQRQNALTVMLVKVATSEKYWFETVKNAHVRFFAGRIKFWDEENTPHYGATFPSALVIFSPEIETYESSCWDYRKDIPERLF